MATKKWSIDPAHSEIRFKIRHLMISNVTGSFNSFEGTAETEDSDFTKAKVSFSANVNSIDTGNEQRDGHLQAADIFDTEKFPAITFTSTGMQKTADDSYTLSGDLTIRGVTKNIKLDVEAGGVADDSYGNTRAGFTITGKIHRADFGLTFNVPSAAGGLVLGEDVKLDCEVQFILAK